MAELWLSARQLADLVDDLQQIALIFRPAADVVDLATGDANLVDDECVQRAEVAGVEQVAHLGPVPIDGQRPVFEDRVHEVGDPTLVLGAVLVGAVDAALPQDDGVHIEAAGVVPHVLVGRTLAAPVRAVEVQGLRFFTGAVVMVELSVHLIRRCEEKRGVVIVQPDGLEHVERAARIDVEVGVGVEQGGRDRHLPGKVEDRVLVANVLG